MSDLPRLPPGQVVAKRWPVLHHGDIPVGPDPWTIHLFGAVRRETVLTLAALQTLPRVAIPADVHCVTGWSLLESVWTGVPFAAVEARAAPLPTARFLMAHAAGGWTTNVALADARHPGVVLAWARNGEALMAAHGGPLRLIIAHLYFWKSCKWLVGLEWMTEDRPGFWEADTKYSHLDPWHAVRADPPS